MKQLPEAMERRNQKRVRQQLPCSLLVAGTSHRGVVRDLSARGLFVQIARELEPGSGAIVAFHTPEGSRFILEAAVPYRASLSRSLSSLTCGGVGLRIVDPPAAYLRWVASLEAGAS